MTLDPKSSPANTLVSEAELDETSLSAIRSILTEEAEPVPRSILGRVKRQQDDIEPKVAAKRRKADAFVPLEDAQEDGGSHGAAQKKVKRVFSLRRKRRDAPKNRDVPFPSHAGKPQRAGQGEGLMYHVRAYRPTPAHIAFALIALLVLMRPWLVFGLLFIFVLVLVGVFLIAGYDGFWQGIIKASRWYAKRRPSRAAILHDRMDRFAVRWDAVLDRFPEGTVDGLYLPDFAELATADARHEEALERRLAGLQGKGA
ncbi:hypothetical protein [uncultured Sulfitobacter sp.]|uniref:hypothetical protein n=1 Tax=uncultured Sulfitobacter sp. TaxID=191468 RepID=UPI00263128AF|nr:hypothetical protein [uncultured Sulfitobacter sp.]